MSFPRYPEYKDSGVEWLGEVPAHWRIVRLRRVVQMNPSKSEVANLDRDTEVSFLPMEAVGEDGSLDLSRTRRIGDVETGYTYFRDGDVAFAKITPCFENGKGALMRGLEHGFGFGTTELTVVRTVTSQSDPSFIDWLFRSPEFRRNGEASMYGAGGQKRVPDDFVREFQVALPPVEEQFCLAQLLDSETSKIDGLIAEQEKLIALLKEKRQAVISHAVTKGLDPNVPMKDSGIEWLGEVPAHWEHGSLVRFSNRIVVGIAEAATHAYADSGIPILRSTNIRAGRIIGELLYVNPEYSEGRDSKVIRARDLITVRTGAAGVTAVVPDELDGCQCFTMLITTLIENIVPEFMCYWMNSLPAQTYFSLEGWGTAQVNISVPILKALPVPAPPHAEQAEIIAFLDVEVGRVDALIAESKRGIGLLQERRTSLISAAVTGKIDVRQYKARVVA